MTETVTERKTLRDWRVAQGLTQIDLAKMLQTSNRTVSAIERGDVEPSAKIKLRLRKMAGAKALRCHSASSKVRFGKRSANPDDPHKPLKWWRETRSLSQEELAALAGISARSILNIERGAVLTMRPHNRRRLAKALNVLPDRIVFPGDEYSRDALDGPTAQSLMRSELRAKVRVIRRAYDFLRDGANVTHRAQDSRGYVDLLDDIQRELRGT